MAAEARSVVEALREDGRRVLTWLNFKHNFIGVAEEEPAFDFLVRVREGVEVGAERVPVSFRQSKPDVVYSAVSRYGGVLHVGILDEFYDIHSAHVNKHGSLVSFSDGIFFLYPERESQYICIKRNRPVEAPRHECSMCQSNSTCDGCFWL